MLKFNRKETIIITTSQSPKWYLQYISGNPIGRTIAKGLLKDVGIKKVRWVNVGNIANSTRKTKEQFLKKVGQI